AMRFSNTNGTRQSSYGAMLTGEPYIGRFGYSLRVDGQERGVNTNVRSRAIVIHPWSVRQTRDPKVARDSWGCFGLDPDVSTRIVNKTKNGSLWYVEPNRLAVRT